MPIWIHNIILNTVCYIYIIVYPKYIHTVSISIYESPSPYLDIWLVGGFKHCFSKQRLNKEDDPKTQRDGTCFYWGRYKPSASTLCLGHPEQGELT